MALAPCRESPKVQLRAMLESVAGYLANKRWPEAAAGSRAVLRQTPGLAEARAVLVKAIERDPANLEPQRTLAARSETLPMRQEAAAADELILLTAPGDAEAEKGKTRCAEMVVASRSASNIGDLVVSDV
jgi:hypothetical protein